MKKILISIFTIILISVAMMSSVYAAQLETTIEITPSTTEVLAGDKVVFTFVLKNVVNAQDDSIGAIAGKVTYDTNFFELVTGPQNTTFTEGGESGEAFNVLATAKEGETIAILTLKVKDNPTGSGIVSFTDLEASDGDMDKEGTEGVAKTPDKQIEIQLKSTEPEEPDDDKVEVTGITITPLSQKVKVGKSTTFVATVTPDNATNKKVTWSSSDEKIATVNENGVVTGIKEGTATITATTEDGNKKATATITVEKEDVTIPDGKDDTETPDTPKPSEPSTNPDIKVPSSEQPTTNGTTVTVGGNNNDTTIADTVIPKAGINAMLVVVIAIVIAGAIIIYKKNQDLKDIK